MQVILHDNCEINTFYDSSAEFNDELQFGEYGEKMQKLVQQTTFLISQQM